MLFACLSILVLAFWISRLPHFQSRYLRFLPAYHPLAQFPLVTMIVPARNEEGAIEANVRSLLSQTYPELQLIVIDDRSTDRTGDILDQLALEYPSLCVIHQRELPDGWLGKCWALHRGSQLARGEWLLFCDGDVLLKPDALQRAVSVAEEESLDHLAMAPYMITESWWEEAVISTLSFLFFIFQHPRDVADVKRPKAYMGVGAFNMVRRSLYQSWGGHETLRLEVIDDVFIGMLTKRNGGRSNFFLGFDLASIRWYPGLWAYIKGIEKNSFAGLRFSLPLLIVAILGQILIFHGPLIFLAFSEGWTRLGFGASLLISHGCFAWHCMRQRVGVSKALVLTLAILIQFFAFARSAWITLRNKGIYWRGNFYPLNHLREAQIRLRTSPNNELSRFGKN